jgi:diguanylate cyclase (GGDEF)-like protein
MMKNISKYVKAKLFRHDYEASATFYSVRISLAYLMVGGAWILLSDIFLRDLNVPEQNIILLSIIKGLLYVLITAVLCFFIVNHTMKKVMKAISDAQYLAYYDELTGLHNRRYMESALADIDKEANLPLSIVVGDFNGLKLVNDAFGRMLGDELLKLSAKALKNACREDDIISRWGSDEFLIMLPRTDYQQASEMVKRIKEECRCHKLHSLAIDITFGWDTKQSVTDRTHDVIKKAEDIMYKYKIVDSKSMRSNTIKTIMRTLHEKNPREAAHSTRVGELCRALGEAAGFSSIDANMINTIGFLHDIGKIAIEEEVLNKKEKLTDKELESIRQHPEIGYRILISSYSASDITEAVLAHHEKWDGTGYPKGLKGENIPMISRIIAIADSYDAMTSERPYKETMSTSEAVEEIIRNAGRQFDPALSRLFIEKVLGCSYEHV